MRLVSGHPDIPWYRAVGAMIGAIIGVGVFGLPYAFAQSGAVIGFLELLIVGGLLLALQLMYADVVLQTPGRRRFTGYVQAYLGKTGGRVATVTFAASAWGAMLAYMILGGEFLFTLLSPFFGGSEFWYQMILLFVVAAMTIRGIHWLARIEVWVIGALLFLFVFIVLLSLPHANLTNLVPANPAQWFFPYGIILFALSGFGVVPEMKDILGRRAKELPHAVFAAQTIIVGLFALFALVVVAVTGDNTTPAPFVGLIPILGEGFGFVSALLGSLTVLSIFSLMAVQLQGIFHYDHHVPRTLAWGISLLVPLVLFLLGVRAFIDLIGFVGAVFGGFSGVLLVLTYERMRRSPVCVAHHCLRVPRLVSWSLIAIFLLGIFFTLTNF